MDKNSRLKKIDSLRKQVKLHKEKIESYKGSNYALIDYWEKEVEQFEEEIKDEEGKL